MAVMGVESKSFCENKSVEESREQDTCKALVLERQGQKKEPQNIRRCQRGGEGSRCVKAKSS